MTHSSSRPLWRWTAGDRPLVAAAIHDGHDVREAVAQHLALSWSDRRREEDPFTARWTDIAPTRLVVLRSRFEVDLNRPRDKAIYRCPEDAWGLQVWQRELPEALVAESIAEYDAFYDELGRVCRQLEQQFERFVIFDLHTYNHCRQGWRSPAADAAANPEINLGTGTMNRQYWSPIVDRWLSDLRQFDFLGRRIDVRENVKFQGGHFAQWIHQHFPQSACVLSIEVKKFFMNEWTHQPDPIQLEAVHQALASTVPGVFAALQQMRSRSVKLLASQSHS